VDSEMLGITMAPGSRYGERERVGRNSKRKLPFIQWFHVE
jgi:hypothetical protein